MKSLKLRSLKVCSVEEVKCCLQASQKKMELYVSEVNPELFTKLNLSSEVDIEVTMVNHISEQSNFYFYHLFHDVLYKSLRIEVDINKIRLVKELRLLSALLLTFLSVIFVVMTLAQPFKIGLFSVIILVTTFLYVLCLQKPILLVTHLERRTHFKIINETWLEQLPALYVIDEDEVYIGGNFFNQNDEQVFYKVNDEIERLKLLKLYRVYTNQSSYIDDKSLIGYYFEILQGIEGEVQTSLE